MNTPVVVVFLTEIDRAREFGLPWTSVHAARWDYRHRHQRGVAEAFVHVGRRIGVYPDRYHELLRARAHA